MRESLVKLAISAAGYTGSATYLPQDSQHREIEHTVGHSGADSSEVVNKGESGHQRDRSNAVQDSGVGIFNNNSDAGPNRAPATDRTEDPTNGATGPSGTIRLASAFIDVWGS